MWTRTGRASARILRTQVLMFLMFSATRTQTLSEKKFRYRSVYLNIITVAGTRTRTQNSRIRTSLSRDPVFGIRLTDWSLFAVWKAIFELYSRPIDSGDDCQNKLKWTARVPVY